MVGGIKKRFGHKVYELDRSYSSKEVALKKAKGWRKSGWYNARVSRIGEMWGVWIREKRK